MAIRDTQNTSAEQPRHLDRGCQAERAVIMSLTGHRSADMVRKYIREGNPFTSNPAGMVRS